MLRFANEAEGGRKKRLKERAVSELEEYAVITAYLWLLFALFSLHTQLVQGHGMSGWQHGFAIVNALIFGKVILIGQALVAEVELGITGERQRTGIGAAMGMVRFHAALAEGMEAGSASPRRLATPIHAVQSWDAATRFRVGRRGPLGELARQPGAAPRVLVLQA
jgi:hypothetical protein